jgi:endonuclease III
MREVTAYLLAFGSLLEGDDYQWDGILLAKNNPNGYLMAVVLDQGMKAEKVWAMPNKLPWNWHNMEELAVQPLDKIEQDLKAVGCRYWRNMARFIKDDAHILMDKYNGWAENIWMDYPTSVQMYERFLEFKGIGQKKASMAVNILVRDCGVPVSDKSGIDVSYDKHIRQVFLRSGLAEYDDLNHIVAVARKEKPEYPGALDKPSWYIGRDWCFNQNPDCAHCPLGNVCAKKVEIVVKGEE